MYLDESGDDGHGDGASRFFVLTSVRIQADSWLIGRNVSENVGLNWRLRLTYLPVANYIPVQFS